MSAVKISKIGNSQGITLPKEILEKGNFQIGDNLEVHFYNGKLIIFKKLQHHSEMDFSNNEKLSPEERDWLDADLGEWDKE